MLKDYIYASELGFNLFSFTYAMKKAVLLPKRTNYSARTKKTKTLSVWKDSSDILVLYRCILFKNKTNKKAVDYIETETDKLIKDGKFVVSLGSEHTITLGLVKSHLKKYKNFQKT